MLGEGLKLGLFSAEYQVGIAEMVKKAPMIPEASHRRIKAISWGSFLIFTA